MHIDIDIVVFAVIAVALLARLWSLFGTRGEDEPQRPNPFIPQTPIAPPAGQAGMDEPFVALQRPPLPPASLAGGLAQVKAADSAFDEKAFLAEARSLFTAVVETYATGNLASIADKLSPELLAHFQASADARQAQGQTAQSRIDRIEDVETVTARAEGTQVFVSVKFVSDQENILRDNHGAIIGGAAGKTESVTDVWTFARNVAADGKWILVETRG